MEAGAALVKGLIDAGVDTAFTVPGESFLAVLEALRRARNQVRLISVRQEGGGTLAAHGYGQARGFPAAVFVSRGPGATNAAIGLHAAFQDSVPMVLFMGQVRSHMQGREAFQEIDPHSTFASMTKAVLQPARAADLPGLARRAVEIALAGRPGPVVVTMPRDFGEEEVDPDPEAGPVMRLPVTPDPEACAPLIAALNAAQRPLIIAGELARGAAIRPVFTRFVEAAGAPVLAAYRCQDVIDNAHPAYAGHLEINPVREQDQLIADSDLLLLVGSRLDGITSREENLISGVRNWVHIHPDKAVLERFSAPHQILSDVGPALEAITPALTPPPATRHAGVAAAHQAWLSFSEARAHPVAGAVDLSIIAAEAREILDEISPASDGAVVITDGGSYARWIHRFFRFRGPSSQGGTASGAMGAGVPGGLGAALGCVPGEAGGRIIVSFCGDGGFMMNGQELSTAVRENIPLKVVVCDNDVHGSILKGQLDKYGPDHAFATEMASPNFADLARGYGAPAWTVRHTGEWRAAFTAALTHDGPALIHVIFDARDIAPYGNETDAV